MESYSFSVNFKYVEDITISQWNSNIEYVEDLSLIYENMYTYSYLIVEL